MQASTARRLAWVVGVASIAMLIAGIVFMFLGRRTILPNASDGWSFTSVLDVAVSIGVPIIGIAVASNRRENPIGWLFLAAGLALGLGTFSRAYALHALRVDPGSLPLGRGLAWLGNWIWPIAVCMLPFLFLLFPTGHLLSRRWRPVAWLAAGVLAVLISSALIFSTANTAHPFANQDLSVTDLVYRVAVAGFLVALFALPVALLAGFASVLIRFSRSSGEERLQLKWFVTAAALVAVTMSLTVVTGSSLAQVFSDVSLVLLYVAIGIAILKHRLYEIDVIIGKTIVYGSLAAFITVVYVVVVVMIGAFVGATQGLALVATAIVAVAFQPLRARVQRFANRVVYGSRATPYEVLSGFSKSVGDAYAGEDILPRMARLLAEGTGASNAVVWLRVDSRIRQAASWPPDAAVQPSKRLEGEALPDFAETSLVAPVSHQGELLGALTVRKPPNETIVPAEVKLVDDLASQAGLVLRNFRLIEDLRASRQRLVAAQDEERRRLERNLHDGAQQQLVALAVKVRLAESLVGGEAERQRDALREILSETQEALDNLRDLARGIYPPLLADRGLQAALEAQTRKAPLPVTVEAAGIGRYEPEIEAAVYFCVLEALQNVAKYAEAASVSVRLREEKGDLFLSVDDDGRGFDRYATPLGMGLQNMSDRLAALGGSLDVRTRPGSGTSVVGRIPARSPEAAEPESPRIVPDRTRAPDPV